MSWAPGRGWGWTWGEDDEVGALNSITPDRVVESLRGVEHGRVYDLGVTVDRTSYLAPAHAQTEVVAYRTPAGLFRDGSFPDEGADRVSFNTSVVMVSDHAGTHLDGLSHATSGPDRHWFNGYTDAEHAVTSVPCGAAPTASRRSSLPASCSTSRRHSAGPSCRPDTRSRWRTSRRRSIGRAPRSAPATSC